MDLPVSPAWQKYGSLAMLLSMGVREDDPLVFVAALDSLSQFIQKVLLNQARAPASRITRWMMTLTTRKTDGGDSAMGDGEAARMTTVGIVCWLIQEMRQIHDNNSMSLPSNTPDIVAALIAITKFRHLSSCVVWMLTDHPQCFRWVSEELVDGLGNALIPHEALNDFEEQVCVISQLTMLFMSWHFVLISF